MKKPVVFRQFFENITSTYTYIIGCEKTRNAVIIDPVLETVERDVKYVKELNLNLVYGINTHVHADHVTGTGALKNIFSSMKSVLCSYNKAKADIYINFKEKLQIGEIKLDFKSTPGHTEGCMIIISEDLESAFTGDTLLIRSCGRTDFQGGSPEKLYNSIHENIFTLPNHYKLYPAHDYNGVTNTTVEEEKKYNPRLTQDKENFIKTMNNLNLPYPKQIDKAVPLNIKCGIDF
ncbi:Persulfide dioxygenase ETHE1, mitochondrial [Strongyloides ratti]|uniref:Persulfide dioxygenase ETHE1, mitochondrial n=1 Tax=Strongyloides ratti TaxID=34506 RepID=A0A090LG62_STRRB|nr:Persulfide dioxygenase ETHE1, mitochondrial [Strongyloides ratti]CEF66510.1 Persulfide dioxygenase ETHE1, mitochondrial [Strongyloides ratti]